MPRIPPELVYHFLDHMQDSHCNTLCACSLVCREWLPITRERLFRDVQLCEVQAPGDQGRTKFNLEGFRDLLESTAGVSFVVRSLSVNRRSHRMPTLPYEILVCVLEMLPNLEKLSLDNMYLPGTFPDLHSNIPFFSLRSLRLAGMQNPSQSKYAAAAFFDFLGLFSVVEETELAVRLFKESDEDLYHQLTTNYLIPVGLNTSTLRLGSTELDQGVFMHYFLMSSILEPVKELAVSVTELAHIISPLALFLAHERCALETLTLEVSWRWQDMSLIRAATPIVVPDAIKLTLGPALRSLRSLRTFHLSTQGVRASTVSWSELLLLLQFLPRGLVELHLYHDHAHFPFEDGAFEGMMSMHPDLKKVYIHTPFSATIAPAIRWRSSRTELHFVSSLNLPRVFEPEGVHGIWGPW